MRVLLVGSPAERRRVLADLRDRAIRVAAEFETLAAARASGLNGIPILLAGDGDAAPASSETLTPREIEVMELLAEGLPNKRIASRLQISDQTVKVHLASIMGKLGAANRTDAVRRAVGRGLVTL